MTKHISTIKEKVTSAIASGNTHMRPKWHFVLRGALLSLGLILIAIALLYVTSLIVFAFKQTGLIMTPGMGGHGLGVFFSSAPWILIGTTILFIIVLEILARKFAFVYKQPLLLSLVVIFSIATIGTFAISQTRMHEFLHKQVRMGALPGFDPLYRGFDEGIPDTVFPGVITNIDDDTLTLERPDGTTIVITLTDDTHFMRQEEPSLGDHAVILIHEEDGSYIAEHIRYIEEDVFLPFREWEEIESSMEHVPKQKNTPPSPMK
jgi:hypothetical protein